MLSSVAIERLPVPAMDGTRDTACTIPRVDLHVLVLARQRGWGLRLGRLCGTAIVPCPTCHCGSTRPPRPLASRRREQGTNKGDVQRTKTTTRPPCAAAAVAKAAASRRSEQSRDDQAAITGPVTAAATASRWRRVGEECQCPRTTPHFETPQDGRTGEACGPQLSPIFSGRAPFQRVSAVGPCRYCL